ncbi:putative TBP interacting domain protein [Aspergillus homomorphus CBS 101889]|uniref:TBPIP-domain-containing protein n=1 Tax=Aspergillus homomorphus (strain CBS 101889) TaxID=1450537 RepID=A0A395HKF3_ASPHC|nr:TBPIP-domain-containing protein [Aspergillus homomorphus CBS 101889]RAL08411.1 TBPIP-domain-containing protein [Aspergillus homomorphus CBS 101889]
MTSNKAKGSDVTRSDATNDGVEVILDYLQRQNRPYSISINLHQKVTKAYATRTLRELWHNKQIEGRTAGKQVVYHALQEASNETTSETIAALDQHIDQVQKQFSCLQAQEKKARVELAALCAKPLHSELRRDISQLEQEQAAARALWLTTKGNDSMHVHVQTRAGAEEAWKRWQKHASSRGRICRDLWQKCSEALPGDKSRDEFWESLGLEGPSLS